MAMNFGDTNDTATGTSQDNNSSNSNNNNNNNNNPVLKKTHSESSTLTSANAHQYHGHHHHRQNQHQQHQHRGIRVTRSSGSVQTSSSLYKPTKNDYYHNNNDDHHTFATATTASATISYSHTEEEEGSTSEAGMEVVMDQEERLREEQILSLLQDYPTTTTTATATATTTAQEEPYISHTFTAGKHTFTVDTRYSLIRVIGSGAYGVVISAKDAKKEAAVLALKETNRRNNTNKNDGDDNDAESVEVAIKMVPRAFHDEIDAKRILREIKLLQHFQHENIVAIRDMMPPECKYVEDFTDVYMVTDLMETDLHRIIYSKQKLSMDHVQYFVYQVLRGLKYIHSCNVLHRDLKPSNLLVNSNCDLKICDFGLARGIYDDDVPDLDQNRGSLILTEYVVTRWYRAPEIMLACHQYSKPIDVWSVGCIFAELILRKPYFPGDDYIDQVRYFLFVVVLCIHPSDNSPNNTNTFGSTSFSDVLLVDYHFGKAW